MGTQPDPVMQHASQMLEEGQQGHQYQSHQTQARRVRRNTRGSVVSEGLDGEMVGSVLSRGERHSVVSMSDSIKRAMQTKNLIAEPEKPAPEAAAAAAASDEPSRFFVMLCIGMFLVADIGKNVAEAMAVMGQGINTNWCIAVYSMVNLVVAPAITWWFDGKDGLRQLFIWEKLKCFMWPALIFALSMGVNLMQSNFLSAGTKKVLTQLRIPLTAFMSRYVLGVGYSMLSWVAILMILISIFCFQFLADGSSTDSNFGVGLVLAIVGAILAVLGSLVAEKFLKAAKGTPFYIQKFQIEVWQLLFSILNMFVIAPYMIGGFYTMCTGSSVIADKNNFAAYKTVLATYRPNVFARSAPKVLSGPTRWESNKYVQIMEAFNSPSLTSNDKSLEINDNSRLLIQKAVSDMRHFDWDAAQDWGRDASGKESGLFSPNLNDISKTFDMSSQGDEAFIRSFESMAREVGKPNEMKAVAEAYLKHVMRPDWTIVNQKNGKAVHFMHEYVKWINRNKTTSAVANQKYGHEMMHAAAFANKEALASASELANNFSLTVDGNDAVRARIQGQKFSKESDSGDFVTGFKSASEDDVLGRKFNFKYALCDAKEDEENDGKWCLKLGNIMWVESASNNVLRLVDSRVTDLAMEQESSFSWNVVKAAITPFVYTLECKTPVAMADTDNSVLKKKLEGCEFHGESKLVKAIQAAQEQEQKQAKAVAAVSRRNSIGSRGSRGSRGTSNKRSGASQSNLSFWTFPGPYGPGVNQGPVSICDQTCNIDDTQWSDMYYRGWFESMRTRPSAEIADKTDERVTSGEIAIKVPYSKSFFVGWSFLMILAVIFNVFQSWMSGIVSKVLSSLVKNILSAVAMCLIVYVEIVMRQTHVLSVKIKSMNTFVGVCAVFVSAMIFALLPKPAKPSPPKPEETAEPSPKPTPAGSQVAGSMRSQPNGSQMSNSRSMPLIPQPQGQVEMVQKA